MRKLLGFVALSLLMAITTTAQVSTSIDFEQLTGPSYYTLAHPLTVDVATFTGGQLVTNLSWINRSSVYATSYALPGAGYYYDEPYGYVHGYMVISFSQPVNNITFKLQNLQTWWPWYTVADDKGDSFSFRMPNWCYALPYCYEGHPEQLIAVPFKDVRSLVISTGVGYIAQFNFAIDEISYEKATALGPVRVVAGFSNDLVPYTTAFDNQTFRFPLGSTLFAKLAQKQEDGTWRDIPATFALDAAWVTKDPRVNKTSLYRDQVLLPFGKSVAGEPIKHFLAVHLGNVKLRIKPDDRALPEAVAIMEINEPGTIGEPKDCSVSANCNDTRFDKYITKYAHKSGIPPQYIKAQIEKETEVGSPDNFDPMAWRYELKHDYVELRPATCKEATRPGQWSDPPGCEQWKYYRLTDGPRLCPAMSILPDLPETDCIFPDLDDLAPRERTDKYRLLKIVRNGTRREIQHGDDPITMREIYEGSNSVWHWDLPAGVRTRPVRPYPDPLNVVAQTTMSSSYGLMQVMWDTAVTSPLLWGGINDRRNPSLLFDTERNLESRDDAGSLYLGTKYLAVNFEKANRSAAPQVKSKEEFEAALSAAYVRYNQGPGYGASIFPRVSRYEPQPSTVVSNPESCSPPTFLDATDDISIPVGSIAILHVPAEGSAPLYEWFLGFEGDESNHLQASFDAVLQVSPTHTSTYWLKASNDCGVATRQVTVHVRPSCAVPESPRVGPDATIEIGDSATLSVTAENSTEYQWFEGVGPTEPGTTGDRRKPITTGPTLIVSPVVTTNYWALASNSCGGAPSPTIAITVNCDAPVATVEPTQVSMYSGETLELHASATGSEPLAYQWFEGPTGDDSKPVVRGQQATLSIAPTATTSYWVAVTNPCGVSKSVASLVTVVPCKVPDVTIHPHAYDIYEGEDAILELSLEGTPPLSHAWFEGTLGVRSHPLESDAAGTLTVRPTATTSYWVEISSPCGIASDAAAIAVHACAPTIVNAPQDTTIGAGEILTLAVSATIDGPSALAYQWFEAAAPEGPWRAIPHATDDLLTTVPEQGEGWYKVAVSSRCGATETLPVRVTVVPDCTAPFITTDLPSQVSGLPITLSVEAGGTLPVSFQWYELVPLIHNFRWEPIINATESTYTVISNWQGNPDGYYYVEVRNQCGSALSSSTHVSGGSASFESVVATYSIDQSGSRFIDQTAVEITNDTKIKGNPRSGDRVHALIRKRAGKLPVASWIERVR